MVSWKIFTSSRVNALELFLFAVLCIFLASDCCDWCTNPVHSVDLRCKHCFIILSVYYWSSVRPKAVVLFCLNVFLASWKFDICCSNDTVSYFRWSSILYFLLICHSLLSLLFLLRYVSFFFPFSVKHVTICVRNATPTSCLNYVFPSCDLQCRGQRQLLRS